MIKQAYINLNDFLIVNRYLIAHWYMLINSLIIFGIMKWCSMKQNSQQQIKTKFEQYQKVQQDQKAIKIGYYPIMGKAQYIRFICEYLHIQYQNIFFTPELWQQYQQKQAKDWKFKKLPFIKDTSEDNFIVTEPIPCSIYLINKSGRTDLLGKNLADQAKVDMFVWGFEVFENMISIKLRKPSLQQVRNLQFTQTVWREHFEPKLVKYERAAKGLDQWYIGYLTIIDFSLALLYHYSLTVFQDKIRSFKVLSSIYAKFMCLPEIKAYFQSERAIIQMCPKIFFTEFATYRAIKSKQKLQSK